MHGSTYGFEGIDGFVGVEWQRVVVVGVEWQRVVVFVVFVEWQRVVGVGVEWQHVVVFVGHRRPDQRRR
jgi:hypothetical protein